MDFQIGFIHVAGASCLSTSLSSQLIRKQRSEAGFPIPDRFVGKDKASLQNHLSSITKTQFGAQSPEDHKENDLCGIFQEVKRGASTFMKERFVRRAAKCPIAENGFLPLFLWRKRGTGWAPHLAWARDV